MVAVTRDNFTEEQGLNWALNDGVCDSRGQREHPSFHAVLALWGLCACPGLPEPRETTERARQHCCWRLSGGAPGRPGPWREQKQGPVPAGPADLGVSALPQNEWDVNTEGGRTLQIPPISFLNQKLRPVTILVYLQTP